MSSIVVNFLGNASGLIGAANSGGSALDKWGARAGKAGLAIAGGLAAAAKASVRAAADQSAAVSAWTQVTGKAMDRQQQTIARSLNLSQTDYAKSFTTLSSLYQSNGIAQAKANEMAAKGLKLAADQAAFGNTTVAEAVEAQAGLLKGSGELLEKYAISITAADVAARMKAEGLDKLTGKEGKAAAATVKATLVQEQSAKFLGQAGRESGSLESRQQKLAATVEDFKAKLGRGLLPVVESFVGKLQTAADWVEKNEGKTKILAAGLGILAGVLLTVSVAVKAIAFAQKVAAAATAAQTAAMWLLNAAFLANPIGIIVVALLALGATFAVLWVKCEKFRDIVKGAWEAIKSATSVAWQAIQRYVGVAVDMVKGYIKGWISVVRTVASIFSRVAGAVRDGVENAIGFVRKLPGRIVGALKNAGSTLLGTGRDLIGGLVQGIRDKAGDILSTIKSYVTDKIPGWIKKPLGISSPSKLTMAYGMAIPEGLAIGIKKRSDWVKDAVHDMVDKATVKVDAARDLARSIRDTFAYAFDPQQTDELGKKVGLSLVESLRKQASDATSFVKTINALRKAGLRESAVKKLADEGPGALAAAQEILKGGQIGEINKLVGLINSTGKAFGFSEALTRTGVDLTKERPVKITLDVTGADEDLKKLFRKIVKVEGGGNVQLAFGKS